MLTDLWNLFLAFFIPGIVGYGGGPASIPLIEHEVVHRYGWMSTQEFGEVLALGNAIPGPIATKMAAFVGWEVAGIPGVLVTLLATVGPSLALMMLLMSILLKFKDHPRVKNMTNYIRAPIAVLLGVLTYQFFFMSWEGNGMWQTVLLVGTALLLLEKFKVHPAIVIVSSLLYGAIFLS
ncbi:chromate transporter [Geomicrobium sp. JCM 19039]|uniref:chromate transporter n=1 Tax=Geomicrobium sp. JCM 19039 TaxID=1460636 RepID=UPI00045F44E3|nr:chromate transporter [Geomicrobium sp. JCM 19039]GAK12298.1 chromate transporter [Geomicrobium sp. JCM 19039]